MIDGPASLHDFYFGRFENPTRLLANPQHYPVKLPTLRGGASFVQPQNHLLPLDGGGLSLPAIASRSGEAGGVGVILLFILP